MSVSGAPVAAGPVLVLVVEPYRLMVDALRVHELLPRGEAGGGVGRPVAPVTGGGHLAWRGRLVPMVRLAALFGLAGNRPPLPTAVDVIYGDDEAGTLVGFGVDRVVGMRRLAAAELRPLPPLPPEVARLFTGIVLDPAGGPGLLWLDAGPETLLGMWRALPAAGARPGS